MRCSRTCGICEALVQQLQLEFEFDFSFLSLSQAFALSDCSQRSTGMLRLSALFALLALSSAQFTATCEFHFANLYGNWTPVTTFPWGTPQQGRVSCTNLPILNALQALPVMKVIPESNGASKETGAWLRSPDRYSDTFRLETNDVFALGSTTKAFHVSLRRYIADEDVYVNLASGPASVIKVPQNPVTVNQLNVTSIDAKGAGFAVDGPLKGRPFRVTVVWEASVLNIGQGQNITQVFPDGAPTGKIVMPRPRVTIGVNPTIFIWDVETGEFPGVVQTVGVGRHRPRLLTLRVSSQAFTLVCHTTVAVFKLHAQLWIWEDGEDEERLEELLSRTDVNQLDDHHQSALHYAAGKDNAKATQRLLDMGSDIEARDDAGSTPIFVAARNGSLSTLSLLIQRGCNLSATDASGVSPLMWSIICHHTEAALTLIEAGCNILCCDQHGMTAFLLAAKMGDLRVIESLISHGVDVNVRSKMGYNATHLAGVGGHINILEVLKRHGVDMITIDAENNSLLHLAIQTGNMNLCNWAVSNGNTIHHRNLHGLTPILVSATTGNGQLLHWCILQGSSLADRTLYGVTPFLICVSRGDISLCRYVLQMRPECLHDRTSSGVDAMTIAKHEQKEEMIEMLMEERQRRVIEGVTWGVKTLGVVTAAACLIFASTTLAEHRHTINMTKKTKKDRSIVTTVSTYSPSRPNIVKQFREAFKNPLVLAFRGSVLPSLCVPVTLLSLWSLTYVILHKYGLTLSLTSSLIPILSLVTGLLVSFRTSSAYDRWWEGRRCFSTITSLVRNYVRTVQVFVSEGEHDEDRRTKKELLNLLPAFVRATKHHLRDERGSIPDDVAPYLPDGYVSSSSHRNIENLPLEITFLLTQSAATLLSNKRIEPAHFSGLNSTVNALVDNLSSLERISTTPIPLAYQIHLKQLVTLYCLSLAPQLVDSLGFYCIFVTAFAAFAFFGIDYIGLEIENPFGYDFNDLPVEKFCREIENEVNHVRSIHYNPVDWTKAIDAGAHKKK
ncbi:hypothetical protein PROFUN_08565 [Planoprotostelium fungivorum]|uniref:Uncharacterized protein n=1 Tax=Planoprotostelium fungivorum TaxID=1890364 RepID=A0A2P6N1T0_9EUKA|nr:hypothetical protein PROFUN_08565 [Planoprotostelium fungivorum]